MVRLYLNSNKKKISVFSLAKSSYSIGDMNYIKNPRAKILGCKIREVKKESKKVFSVLCLQAQNKNDLKAQLEANLRIQQMEVKLMKKQKQQELDLAVLVQLWPDISFLSFFSSF